MKKSALRKYYRYKYKLLQKSTFELFYFKILFTNKGWKHISGISKVRTPSDIYRRIKIIPEIKLILLEENLKYLLFYGEFLVFEFEYCKRRFRMVTMSSKSDYLYIFISIFEVNIKR